MPSSTQRYAGSRGIEGRVRRERDGRGAFAERRDGVVEKKRSPTRMTSGAQNMPCDFPAPPRPPTRGLVQTRAAPRQFTRSFERHDGTPRPVWKIQYSSLHFTSVEGSCARMPRAPSARSWASAPDRGSVAAPVAGAAGGRVPGDSRAMCVGASRSQVRRPSCSKSSTTWIELRRSSSESLSSGKSCRLRPGMREVETEGAPAAHDHARVAAVDAVVGAAAGPVEQVVGLRGPVFEIVGAVDAEALPECRRASSGVPASEIRRVPRRGAPTRCTLPRSVHVARSGLSA
jgi:hypothetical protein